MNHSHLKGTGPQLRQAMSMLPLLAPMIPSEGAPLIIKALLWILARPLATKLFLASLVIYGIVAICLSILVTWYIGPLMLIILCLFFGIALARIGRYFKNMMDGIGAGKGMPGSMFGNTDMNNMFDLAQGNEIEGTVLEQPEVKTVATQDAQDRRARAAKYIDKPKKQQMQGGPDDELKTS